MRACAVEGCERKHTACGYCDYHYRESKTGKSFTPPGEIRLVIQPKRPAKICSFIGCGLPMHSLEFCVAHYAQYRKRVGTDKPLTPLKRAGEYKYPRMCTFAGCKNGTHANGLCSTHNRQRLQGMELAPITRANPCTVEGCGKEHVGRGYCKVHYNIWRAYRIDPAHYDRMWAEQGGTCAICRGKCQRHGDRLSVDHDHQTGEVRGLLCAICNLGIGALRDDAELFRRAADYIDTARRIAPGHEAADRRSNYLKARS